MINVHFDYNGYAFSSVEEKDLDELNIWLKKNDDEDGTCFSLEPQIFYRRFLEYYVTENECFLKIKKDGQIAGVFKGRFEKERNNELCIWLFVIDRSLRNLGCGSEMIEEIIKYYKDKFQINSIEAAVAQHNNEGISFWDSMNFKIDRVSKNFFQEKNEGLVIMSKVI